MSGDMDEQEGARAAFDELVDLSMEDYDGETEERTRSRLRALAERASASHLAAFLDGVDGTTDLDEADKSTLVHRYVERRMATILDLRRLRDSFGGDAGR